MSVYGYGGSLNGVGPSLGGTPWVGGPFYSKRLSPVGTSERRRNIHLRSMVSLR